MKKLFLTLFIVLTTFMCFSQKKTNEAAAQAARQEEANSLKARARGASTLGVVSVSAGGLLTLTGVVLMIDGLVGDYEEDYYGYSDYQVNGSRILLGAATAVVGVGVGVVGGVLFFNKARKLRKEARIKLRSTSIMMPQMNKSYTAVNMRTIPQMQLTYTIPL